MIMAMSLKTSNKHPLVYCCSGWYQCLKASAYCIKTSIKMNPQTHYGLASNFHGVNFSWSWKIAHEIFATRVIIKNNKATKNFTTKI